MLKYILVLFLVPTTVSAQQKRARDYGIQIGILPTGKENAITDVTGVKTGHTTIVKGNNIRTGVTAIIPYEGNIFQQKVPAAIYVGNGFGKLAGITQVNELGNIETPIILTNTLNVSTAMDAVIEYIISLKGNEKVMSVNAVVGETNDSYLNDIRGRHVTKEDVLAAINNAKSGRVDEGCVGAGTGTVCFNYKGGIGTSSRKLELQQGGYTVGVLVQTNFGGTLKIDGVPLHQDPRSFGLRQPLHNNIDGSCMIVVATDAPLDHRNLMRIAKRAMLGLARTGGIASNGSGDYVIAFSTAEGNRIPHQSKQPSTVNTVLLNDETSPLFLAVIEATEEAIINSLFMATTTTGRDGNTVSAIPIEKIIPILKNAGRIH